MNSRLRRYEILLPLQFNDGRDVPSDFLADAVLEIVDRFEAASYETQRVEGQRDWMRQYKSRWKEKLDQLDLWLVSYIIDID